MAPQAEKELNLSLVEALVRTMQRLRQGLLPLFAADGLTGGQFETLKVLYSHGPLSVSLLLEKTLSTSGNLDVVLDNLLDKRMISKRLDPADRRRRIIALTPKGRSYIERRFPAHVEGLREMMSVLSASEKAQLVRLLGRLR